MNGHSYVYIIGSSAVKIGFTTDLDSRLKALQAGSPVKLTVQWAAAVTDHPGAESHLHQVFKDKRLHGEWFDLNGDAIGQVSRALERYQIAEVERPDTLPPDPRIPRRKSVTRTQIEKVLQDVSGVFAQVDTDRMWRSELIHHLQATNDRYRDATPADLSRLLTVVFGIAVPVRKNGKVKRGYYRADIESQIPPNATPKPRNDTQDSSEEKDR